MTARLPRVFCVRHGETEWSINGRHTGKSDIPLTRNGEKVMIRSASLFVGENKLIDPRNIARILVSPRQRAHKTFELLRASQADAFDKANAQVEVTEDVAEWDYGDYEGLKPKEIRAIKPGFFCWTDGCPNGESAQQMSDRVDGVIKRIQAIQADYWKKASAAENVEPADVLIVSHGYFSRCFVSRWIGQPLSSGETFAVDAGSVSVLGYKHNTTDEPTLLGLNLYSYLLET